MIGITSLLAVSTATLAEMPMIRLLAGTREGEVVEMPAMGLGTFGYGTAAGGGEWWNDTMVVPVAKEWIKRGGRRLDGARSYKTQVGVGQAIAASIADGVVTRKDLFVTSKTDVGTPRAPGSGGDLPSHLTNDTGYEYTLFQGQQILEITGLEYVDLLLLHWPGSVGGGSPCSSSSGSQKACRQNSWRALQKLLADGKTRAIGVSNFEPEHIADVLELGGVGPALTQNEFHPYWHEDDLITSYKDKKILYQSYSPLGAPDHMSASARNWTVCPMQQPAVETIAKKHARSPAQVILKWAFQLGVSANPRTKNVTQMDENLVALSSDWALDADDMKALGAIEGTGTAPPEKCGPPMFPAATTCANKVCPDPRAIQ